MECPVCRSSQVFRSESTNQLLLRLALQTGLRCHNCSHFFTLPVWRVDQQQTSPTAAHEKKSASAA